MKRVLTTVATLAAATPAHAQLNEALFFIAIPTLDELGLGLLIALVAGVAGWAVRRRSGRK